ncbi:MAG: hypothetical protein PHY47_16325 [Lachnospiraceae bacterium]|nr:hypothetical protein [Lachnospiraceae bacterium]
MDDKILYEPVSIDDLDEITYLYETYLNSGNSIHSYLASGMEDCDYVGFKAVCEGKIVGLVSGRSGIDFTYPHPELEEEIHNHFKDVILYTPDALINVI